MGRDTFDAVLASVPLNGTAGRVTSRSGDHYDPQVNVQTRKYSDIPTHSDLPSRCVPIPKGASTFVDFTGRTWGRFTVVGYLGRLNPRNEKKASWLVRCLCGNYETRVGASIKRADVNNGACLKCLHWFRVQRTYAEKGGKPIEAFIAK